MAVEAAELESHRNYLLRLALLQLHNEAQAQDAVQDTLTAALTARFEGQSSVRTWLTGILKHKVIDLIRRESRFVELARDDNDEIPESGFDDLFSAKQYWSEPPPAWRAPDELLSDRQFKTLFEHCARRLPKKHAQVFMMREILDMTTAEICEHLEISASNCSVILYRARMSLRLCLEPHWS